MNDLAVNLLFIILRMSPVHLPSRPNFAGRAYLRLHKRIYYLADMPVFTPQTALIG